MIRYRRSAPVLRRRRRSRDLQRAGSRSGIALLQCSRRSGARTCRSPAGQSSSSANRRAPETATRGANLVILLYACITNCSEVTYSHLRTGFPFCDITVHSRLTSTLTLDFFTDTPHLCCPQLACDLLARWHTGDSCRRPGP